MLRGSCAATICPALTDSSADPWPVESPARSIVPGLLRCAVFAGILRSQRMRRHLAHCLLPFGVGLVALLAARGVWAFSSAIVASEVPPAWSDIDLSEQALELEVVINGNKIGKIGEFQQHGQTLQATRRELDELGLQAGAGDPLAVLPLDGIAGTSYRVDQKSQTVFIAAPTKSLRPAELGPARVSTSLPSIESAWGAVLDYDLVATFVGGRVAASGVFDARAFSPWGVVSSGVLTRAGLSYPSGGATRLDSTYTYSDPDEMRRFRIGDLIQSSLAWTRPVRLGGLQIARDFSLRPDLVTFPVPTISGQVAVPSTVDVLVNGVQQLSAQASPGPFEIRQLPIVTGANDISLVINNAVGRQVTQTLPVYTSGELLAAGLDAYSAELGSVRLGYGVRSNDYRMAAASASYRRGLTDWLTVGAHGEGTPSLGMAGAGASVALGRLGVGSIAVAGSTARGQRAMLGYAAFERTTPGFSVAASIQWTDGGFRDLAALFGDPAPRSQIRVGFGLPIGPNGSLGVAYTRQRRSTVAPAVGPTAFGLFEPLAETFTLPIRISLLSASYSTPIFGGRAMLYATAFHDFDNRINSGAIFGLTVPLGPRSSASASAGIQADQAYASVQATRSVVAVGDAGGQAILSAGGLSRQLVQGEYKSPWALVDLGADRVGGHTALRASASGALVLAGGGVFASNPIPDSFAIVDTGAKDVQVLSENRPVERTPASGRVLVPDLRSFELNRINIDPSDLPLDVEFGETSRVVRPQDRSGVVVRFPVRRSNATLLRLVDEAGAPLPLGTRARIVPDGEEVAIGYGGEAFVHGLNTHERLDVTLASGSHCLATFDYHPVPGEIPVIGPVTCKASSAPAPASPP